MYKRNYRTSAGTEIAAETEMNACEETVEDISAHILSAKKCDM